MPEGTQHGLSVKRRLTLVDRAEVATDRVAVCKIQPDCARELILSVVAQFEIHYSQFLDEHGKAVQTLPEFARDPQNLVPLYRWMTLMRAYDAKTIALQRTGQIGTFASMLGKEAVEAGVGSAMAKDDVFLMTYRENGVQMMRGVALKELFLYWGGDGRGSNFAVPRRKPAVRRMLPLSLTYFFVGAGAGSTYLF